MNRFANQAEESPCQLCAASEVSRQGCGKAGISGLENEPESGVDLEGVTGPIRRLLVHPRRGEADSKISTCRV